MADLPLATKSATECAAVVEDFAIRVGRLVVTMARGRIARAKQLDVVHRHHVRQVLDPGTPWSACIPACRRIFYVFDDAVKIQCGWEELGWRIGNGAGLGGDASSRICRRWRKRKRRRRSRTDETGKRS